MLHPALAPRPENCDLRVYKLTARHPLKLTTRQEWLPTGPRPTTRSRVMPSFAHKSLI